MNPIARCTQLVRSFRMNLILGGMSDVTQILAAIEAGHPHAPDELLPLVYDELRKLAAAHLLNEQPGQTLQPTALVDEAYLRIIGGPNLVAVEQAWADYLKLPVDGSGVTAVWPLARFHTRTVLSALAVAASCPFGLTATALTG